MCAVYFGWCIFMICFTWRWQQISVEKYFIYQVLCSEKADYSYLWKTEENMWNHFVFYLVSYSKLLVWFLDLNIKQLKEVYVVDLLPRCKDISYKKWLNWIILVSKEYCNLKICWTEDNVLKTCIPSLKRELDSQLQIFYWNSKIREYNSRFSTKINCLDWNVCRKKLLQTRFLNVIGE